MQGLLDDSFNERKRNIAKGFKQDEDDLEKGLGEGSKGGQVIGQTQSGKPVYSHKSAGDYKNFSEQDHADAGQVHNKLMYKHLDKYLNSPRGGGGNQTDLDKKQHHESMMTDHFSRVKNIPSNNTNESKVVYTADHETKPTIKKGDDDDLSKGGVGSGRKAGDKVSINKVGPAQKGRPAVYHSKIEGQPDKHYIRYSGDAHLSQVEGKHIYDRETKPIKQGDDDLSKGGVGSGPRMKHSQWEQNKFHDSEDGYDNYSDAVHGHLESKAGDEPEMEKHIDRHIDAGYAEHTDPKHIAGKIDAHYKAHYKPKSEDYKNFKERQKNRGSQS